MKTSADHVIDGDLAALGEASRRSISALEVSVNSTGLYRDDRQGAEAKRNSLAEVRRRELAVMPLTLSHIYARRIARATAGAAALLCAAGLLFVLDDRLLVQLTALFIPGVAIGMYAVLSVAFVLASYVVATWIAEHKFARDMRALVSTGDDVYRDLDQLAVGPFAVAAEQVRRLDRLSIALPLAGIAVLVPVLAFVGFVGATAIAMPSHAGTTVERFLAMTSDLGPVFLAVIAGGGFAYYVGRACDREHRRGASGGVVRLLGHWSMVIAAGFFSLLTAFAATRIFLRMHRDLAPPSESAAYLLALGGELAIVVGATWALLWYRRRERAQLGD